jgi:DNA-binding transcriptional regulator GbsR (MarR family)
MIEEPVLTPAVSAKPPNRDHEMKPIERLNLPASVESTPPRAEPQALREARERFVGFWGEMASRWGINRTMAQIHALLYVSEEPLDTEAIMDRLGISRGNANMNLRALIDWRLVSKVHRRGSRRDYYEAEKDVWHITAQIIKKRERQEIQPVVELLQECRDRVVPPKSQDALSAPERQFIERIDNLIEMMDVFDAVAAALIPFIRGGNAPLFAQLAQLVESMQSRLGVSRDDES